MLRNGFSILLLTIFGLGPRSRRLAIAAWPHRAIVTALHERPAGRLPSVHALGGFWSLQWMPQAVELRHRRQYRRYAPSGEQDTIHTHSRQIPR